ncbi:HPF/RaiA family ribosome-associated protein [Labrys monachus]|uniref:Cold shock CspA family protein/ribosome-associated translation inhibitor RaiA n=1 Tax=Labrys monachus TaxID=217067 RepID=A0ABU0F8C9_9HYPH|nr:HPF/RaiA family ribosome-associated protein [Labrys monachus]MDQ0390300.1 cold shock CspA family protein/ribosome-associated translation inhibitor RaiA [Labrys monachus]
MQVPIDITFRHCESSDAVRAELDRQLKHLEKFDDRMTSCSVVISGPQTRHRHGDTFEVNLRIAMPGRKDIVVHTAREAAPEHEHALVALRDAFGTARRQVEDAVRDLQGEVKTHAVESHGRVTKFLAGEDCGFIETADGQEIYFHRNAVLDGAFDRMAVGSEVRFVEEQGEKGAQASTVRLIGKHHLE